MRGAEHFAKGVLRKVALKTAGALWYVSTDFSNHDGGAVDDQGRTIATGGSVL